MALYASKMGEHEPRYRHGAGARAAAVKEAVLGHQNGPKTGPGGFGPPVGSLGSSINQEVLQGDD